MPSFHQIARGNWKVQVFLGRDSKGKQKIVKKQGFKTKKDAEAWANEILNQKNKGYVTVSNNIMFNEFLMKWYQDYKKLTLSTTTKTCYIGRINKHILPFFEGLKLNEVSSAIVQDFYNNLVKDMKPSSAKKVMDILISCFKYAKKQKLIMEVPTDIDKIKSEKKKIETWNQEQMKYFLKEIEDTYLHFPVFLDLMTGLRIAELCGLKWKYVNLDEGYIDVVGQIIYNRSSRELEYTKILKTDSSFRRITIPGVLIDYLKEIKEALHPKENDFVVLNREGNMCNPRNLSVNFSKTVAKYNVSKITFHGLRHTHATMLLSAGENIKVVSERLGHQDITTTLNIYMHVQEKMKQNTASLLQNMFEG